MAGTAVWNNTSKMIWGSFFAALLSMSITGCGQTATASTTSIGKETAVIAPSRVKMTLTYQPSPPVALKPFYAKVNLVTASGQPLSQAKVVMHLTMTDMDMPPQTMTLKNDGSGHYSGQSVFLMAGPWKITTDIMSQGKTMKESFTVNVSN
ncbi:FixH family protein [Sulfobacillus thermosulfidooxidans]|uniref:FixH family protein n=1 Tax=Sulfobacillus thermosulfidooxidans TaxID=28034 RepID=UPI00037E3DAE|nr:FixH family protein [Sulfobacillus thermosulfidooxidans]